MQLQNSAVVVLVRSWFVHVSVDTGRTRSSDSFWAIASSYVGGDAFDTEDLLVSRFYFNTNYHSTFNYALWNQYYKEPKIKWFRLSASIISTVGWVLVCDQKKNSFNDTKTVI